MTGATRTKPHGHPLAHQWVNLYIKFYHFFFILYIHHFGDKIHHFLKNSIFHHQFWQFALKKDKFSIYIKIMTYHHKSENFKWIIFHHQKAYLYDIYIITHFLSPGDIYQNIYKIWKVIKKSLKVIN